MLDTEVQNTINNAVSFNSVAGTLVKSCNESKFIRFHADSPLADLVFDINRPRIPYQQGSSSSYIQVLQVMLCGGDRFLVEFRMEED